MVHSALWSASAQVERISLPSAGAMHQRLSTGKIDSAVYDRKLPQRTAAGHY